jgi:hypothetical protein
MSGRPLWDMFLNFLMGQVIDKRVSVKEDMFLPEEAAHFIENFTYVNAAGHTQKLCSSVERLYTASRALPLAAPKSAVPFALSVSLVLILLFYCIRACAASWPLAEQRLFGLAHAALGVLVGVSGLLLFFLEFFTNHDYTYQNFNVLFANPIALAAIPAGFLAAFSRFKERRARARRVLSLLWTYIFIAAVVVALAHLFPWCYQDNSAHLALILPLSFSQCSFFPAFRRFLMGKQHS